MIKANAYGGIASNSNKIRDDIQILRGFAILIVVLYHAKLGFLDYGYLGIDIFYVISGFLITSHISNGIIAGKFRISSFYYRRAKRLLPAAYTTFLFTIMASPFFLSNREMSNFMWQIIGAITYTANIVLWKQAGYFSDSAELKPFLHIWSLSIEEQYYFIIPAVMMFLPRRFWSKTLFIIFIFSLIITFIYRDKVNAVFYLLPFRAWELMIGSFGALMVVNRKYYNILWLLFWPTVISLIIIPIVGLRWDGFDFGVLFICLTTLVIILTRHKVDYNNSTIRGLIKVGNISYSLYLVHWPIFSFFNNVWIDGDDFYLYFYRAGLIALSLVLAILLNRYIEKPFQYASNLKQTTFLWAIFASSVGLICIALIIYKTQKWNKDYTFILRENIGFSADCGNASGFKPINTCRNSDKPEILVWGDSFAMHLVSGLAEAKDNKSSDVIQATRPMCGPLLGLAVTNEKYNSQWARQCIEFNDSVVNYLSSADSVKFVVLSSPFGQYLGSRGMLIKKNEQYTVVKSGLQETVDGLKRTVDVIREMGKKVIVIAPLPTEGINIGRCLERLDIGLVTLTQRKQCKVNLVNYHNKQAVVLSFLRELPVQAGVDVINFDSYLCTDVSCNTKINDILIYRDDGHLTYDGSRFLATEMKLTDQIRKLAR